MKNKCFKHKKKIVLSLILFFSLLILILILFSSSKPNVDILTQYFNKIPSSVTILQSGGLDSMSGANIYICFEIPSTDFKNLVKDNDYLLTQGAFLEKSTFSFRDKHGKLQSKNGLEIEKATAKELGIIPDKLYTKSNSTYSHYWLIIVNKDETKVYFRYYRV